MTATLKSSLYRQIASDLAERIGSGDWTSGSRLPSEQDLMVRYGCARATANKAMQALADAGLIIRRRRAGSFVAKPPLQTAVMEIPELGAEVVRRGQAYGFDLQARHTRRLAEGNPDERYLATGGEMLDLTGVHSADGRPFAAESRIISLATVPQAAGVDFATAPPGAWLLDHVAWSDAEHRISAVAANAPDAERLGLSVGAPCLALRRWTWRAGEGLTYVRLLFPGDAFEVVARFAQDL